MRLGTSTDCRTSRQARHPGIPGRRPALTSALRSNPNWSEHRIAMFLPSTFPHHVPPLINARWLSIKILTPGLHCRNSPQSIQDSFKTSQRGFEWRLETTQDLSLTFPRAPKTLSKAASNCLENAPKSNVRQQRAVKTNTAFTFQHFSFASGETFVFIYVV